MRGWGGQVDGNAERLSAALLEIEDQFLWDATTMFERAVDIEHEALSLGDELMVIRAQLCQTNMQMRAGDISGAARRIWKIHQWTLDHGATQLQARTHLVWANIHRHLGD